VCRIVPLVRERVKVGARISLGARSLTRSERHEPNIVRHLACRLKEIVLVDDGVPAGYIGAVITDLREAKPEPPKLEREGEIIHAGCGMLRRNCGTILGVR
jgi:hypothetical protein